MVKDTSVSLISIVSLKRQIKFLIRNALAYTWREGVTFCKPAKALDPNPRQLTHFAEDLDILTTMF
jgi:hypothetical protein